MRRQTAAFLCSYSERTLGGSYRLPLARAAWRAVSAAAGRGDPSAIEAAWQSWLRRPDDERWELLRRWRDPEVLTEALFAAPLAGPTRPAAQRAALGAFCARHGLAPGDEIDRARFHLLTGQYAQHRAADPDGSALAAAYQAAAEPVQAALRAAMADVGDLDLVRVVAAHSADNDTAVPRSEAERGYLATELARRREWDRLWRLALDLPLAEAVAAVRRLPAGWRPADEAGRQLLTRLSHALPEAVAAAVHPSAARIRVGRHSELYCDFAPDGSGLAVYTRLYQQTGHDGPYIDRQGVTVHALPGGALLDRFRGARSVLHLGDSILYTEKRGQAKYRAVRYSRQEGREELCRDYVPICPERAPGGFFIGRGFVDHRYVRLYGTGVPGSPVREVPDTDRLDILLSGVSSMAIEPVSGRIATVSAAQNRSGWHLAVIDPDLHVIGAADIPRADVVGSNIGWLGFCGPERLITCASGRFHSWRRVGSSLISEAQTGYCPGAGPPDIHVLPFDEQIVFGSGTVLDARTLREVSGPPVLEELKPWRTLFLSPGGDLAVRLRAEPFRWQPSVKDNGELEIRDLRRAEIGWLLSRPLASARPADLARLERLRAAGAAPIPPDADAAADLLHACLQYRFGADAALGQPPRPADSGDISVRED